MGFFGLFFIFGLGVVLMSFLGGGSFFLVGGFFLCVVMSWYFLSFFRVCVLWLCVFGELWVVVFVYWLGVVLV